MKTAPVLLCGIAAICCIELGRAVRDAATDDRLAALDELDELAGHLAAARNVAADAHRRITALERENARLRAQIHNRPVVHPPPTVRVGRATGSAYAKEATGKD